MSTCKKTISCYTAEINHQGTKMQCKILLGSKHSLNDELCILVLLGNQNMGMDSHWSLLVLYDMSFKS